MTMADAIPIERDDTGSPPLVGRESELRALGEGIADARRGRGSLFLDLWGSGDRQDSSRRCISPVLLAGRERRSYGDVRGRTAEPRHSGPGHRSSAPSCRSSSIGHEHADAITGSRARADRARTGRCGRGKALRVMTLTLRASNCSAPSPRRLSRRRASGHSSSCSTISTPPTNQALFYSGTSGPRSRTRRSCCSGSFATTNWSWASRARASLASSVGYRSAVPSGRVLSAPRTSRWPSRGWAPRSAPRRRR